MCFVVHFFNKFVDAPRNKSNGGVF